LRELLLVAAALLIAAPAQAWDKAANPKKRLEILTDAARRADQAQLASCFAEPPTFAVLENALGEAIAWEKGVNELYKLMGEKLAQEGLDALGSYDEAVSDVRCLAGTTITVSSLKEKETEADAIVEFSDKDDPNQKGGARLHLVKVGEDDWRIVFNFHSTDAWPASVGAEPFTEFSSAMAKAVGVIVDTKKGVQEDRMSAADAGNNFSTARNGMKAAWGKLRETLESSVKAIKEKERADTIEAAKKDEAAKKAAADEAAKQEAAKKEAAKKEALKNAPPPPAPPPVAKKDEKKEEEEEKKPPEPDNTGMYIVFGLLGITCMVVVGILLSKMRGEKGSRGGGGGKRGKGGRGGGSSGTNRASGSGRRRR
jgi:hypothetical protein